MRHRRPDEEGSPIARAESGPGTPEGAAGTIGRVLEPRVLVALVLVGISGAAVTVFLIARGELAGADARAYWGAVRVWIGGGDPMAPPAPYMPYVYFPWTLPIFAPWAALPWELAWFLWRGVNVILLLWSAAWAWQRHPLATAFLLAFLAAPIATTLDTGNITLFAALAVWAAAYTGPRLGGGLWALATVLKWFPAPLWLILPPRARLWGLIWVSIALLLSLATWPQTLDQLRLAIGYPRPFRGDYLLLLWAAVPWLWGHPRWFERSEWPALRREGADRARAALRALRQGPDEPSGARNARVVAFVRGFLGIAPRPVAGG